ncbi:hypothetical protein W97_02969 [Coniosporium apollinis CBS 100218]|uniref:Uncharacterized protein n=1 Tax=Coniosporium apollinis (strain CBS 100218) TaxID=1168221 RepID=R7YQ10_CONA1|nr:uncharacterized protein W97_02969 [Coniosporium apollinis CBS 100218]EON63741.1 hypothetical protein W97_02969 [Coniosporium apollinis CBS 100218]
MSTSDLYTPAISSGGDAACGVTPSRTSARKPKPKFPPGYKGIAYFDDEGNPQAGDSPAVGAKRKAPTEGKKRGRPRKAPRIDDGISGISPCGSGPSQASSTPDRTQGSLSGNSAEQTAPSTSPTATSDSILPASDHDGKEEARGAKDSLPVKQAAEETSNADQNTQSAPKSTVRQRVESRDKASAQDPATALRPDPGLIAPISAGRSVQPTPFSSPRDYPARTDTGVKYSSPYTGTVGDGQSRCNTTVSMTSRQEDAKSANRNSPRSVDPATSTRQHRQNSIHYDSERVHDNKDNADNAGSVVQHLSGSLPSGSTVQQPPRATGSNESREQPQSGAASLAHPSPGRGQHSPREPISHPPMLACITQTEDVRGNAGQANAVRKAENVNGAVRSGSVALLQSEPGDDDSVRKLGEMVLEHRRYRKMLGDAESKVSEYAARVQELERSISSKEPELRDLQRQIKLLQEKMQEKQACIDSMRNSLQGEMTVVQTAMSQAEVLKKQMSEIWAQLGF